LDPLVYYVIRQRNGWGVEHAGLVRSGHKSRDGAIAKAREHAHKASKHGHECCLRIQEEAGSWREERSFAPNQ
jgi:hypothetical protein